MRFQRYTFWSHMSLTHNKYRLTNRKRDGLIGGSFEIIRNIVPCDRNCHHQFPFIAWLCEWMSHACLGQSFIIPLHPSDSLLVLNHLSTTIWTETIFSIQNKLYKLMTTRHCSLFLEVNLNRCFYLQFRKCVYW